MIVRFAGAEEDNVFALFFKTTDVLLGPNNTTLPGTGLFLASMLGVYLL